MSDQMILWIIFGVVIVVMLGLDLGVFHRRSRVDSIKASMFWTAFWIGLALLFNVLIYFWRGGDAAMAFLTGFLVEKSLSVDNLFVFLVIFSYFKVPDELRHRALFWGIVGALFMRAVFIYAGIALVEKLHWTIYILGAFLIFTAVKLVVQKDKEVHPERNPLIKIFRRFWPVTEGYEGDHFFARRAGRLFATPLFVVILVIESTDVIFAVDSIPAILGITTDPLIVYTSNIFAIMGLRAIFFALSGFMQLFHHLHYGLSAILAFVGVKMLISGYYKLPISVALGVVAAVLLISVATSLIWPPKVRHSRGMPD